MQRALRQLLGSEFLRYFLVSLTALAIDLGVFTLLLQTQLHPVFAAALGYGSGIVIAWVLLSRHVFAKGAAGRGMARMQQKALFLTMALAGLVLTTGIVGLAQFLGADVTISKGVAILVSFISNYLVRKYVVFRTPGSV